MAARIYWAGDSTVKENTIISYPQTGIGQVMKLYLRRSAQVFDYAENGRSTKSYIDEGRLDIIDSQIEEGDFLFIQFGHNDEKEYDKQRYTTPYGTFTENLEKFVEVARKHKAHPVIITSLYRRLFKEDGKTLIDNTHGEYPQAMIDYGQKAGVPVIDLCSISKRVIEEAGPELTKEWFLYVPEGKYPHFPEGKQDNTHLQYAGAVKFAGLIAEELRKLGGIYGELLLDPSEDLEDPRLLID